MEWEGADSMQLVQTLAAVVEYVSCTQEMKLSPNPNLRRTIYKYSHSITSNAFSASREATTSGVYEPPEWTILVNSIQIDNLTWHKASLRSVDQGENYFIQVEGKHFNNSKYL